MTTRQRLSSRSNSFNHLDAGGSQHSVQEQALTSSSAHNRASSTTAAHTNNNTSHNNLGTIDDASSTNSGGDMVAWKSHNNKTKKTLSCWDSVVHAWRSYMDTTRTSVSYCVIVLSRHAASNPISYLLGVLFLSFALAGVGMLTNFNMTTNGRDQITVRHSVTREQYRWVYGDAGFPSPPESLRIVVHQQGDNVVTKEGLFRAFDVVTAVQKYDGYQELCDLAERTNTAGHGGLCHIRGVPLFFNLSLAMAQEQVLSDVDVKLAVSRDKLPDESTVDPREFMGHIEYFENLFSTIRTAQSFLMEIRIPGHVEHSNDMAVDLLDALLLMRGEWASEQDNNYGLEVYLTDHSLEAETKRAVFEDLPLIPLVFVIMTVFTMVVFSASHKEGQPYRQRFMLGFGAVATILLSMITSFGVLFTAGVPFTNTTQILPFIMFGIGLDDAFIIFGQFARTDDRKSYQDRIHETFQEVGLTTFLTTITTTLAFGLGAMTTIPELQWLAIYAFPTVLVDWVYQITFFVAIIVIDEGRIASRIEKEELEGIEPACCGFWSRKVPQQQQEMPDELELVENNHNSNDNHDGTAPVDGNGDLLEHNLLYSTTEDVSTQDSRDHGGNPVKEKAKSLDPLNATSQHTYLSHYGTEVNPSAFDRLMGRFADLLLKKNSKISVLVFWVIFTSLLIWSSTLFTQEFNIYKILTRDSYVSAFFKSVDVYADRGFVVPSVYFRNVDQSDPEVQQQMQDYIDDLVKMDSITSQPPFFWLKHFQEFLTYDKRLTELTFNEQLTIFLSVDVFRLLYGDHIVRDPETGDIITSRCVMYIDNIEVESVDNQVKAWTDVNVVTAAQPINSDVDISAGDGYHFFMQEDTMLYYWEFLGAMMGELIMSSLFGGIGVAVIAAVFLPHWSAPVILVPMIAILYIDLLGFMQMCGVHLNMISCFAVIVSIGLLVDFNMHILMAYYESTHSSRDGKVKDAMQNIGSSVVIGGISTFLGVVPLFFSKSPLLQNLFYGFWGMVILGTFHGVILLPVILSYCGPLGVKVKHTLVIIDKGGDKDSEFAEEDDDEMAVEQPRFSGQQTASLCHSSTPSEIATGDLLRLASSDLDDSPHNQGLAQNQGSPFRQAPRGDNATAEIETEESSSPVDDSSRFFDEGVRRTWTSPAALSPLSSGEKGSFEFDVDDFDEGSPVARPSSCSC
ncbi:Pick C1-like protein 1 [Seminavis robusta]|uniref:Pick C1-like protein 1 n=1 Tax=Seminavis robusta TaxID=568900 RepID=A0A9N8DHP2_9STRA|nr:Pick C1-like protein 1 [Seminavis robusta]|eukprot:Sro163_g073360.1 Pick C1-like protein 1 (1187) ;mRNA; r:83687-87429